MATKTRGTEASRKWRAAKGLTQTQASQLVGIDAFYFSKIERGARCPGRSVAVAFERASEGLVTPAMWDEDPIEAGEESAA